MADSQKTLASDQDAQKVPVVKQRRILVSDDSTDSENDTIVSRKVVSTPADDKSNNADKDDSSTDSVVVKTDDKPNTSTDNDDKPTQADTVKTAPPENVDDKPAASKPAQAEEKPAASSPDSSSSSKGDQSEADSSAGVTDTSATSSSTPKAETEGMSIDDLESLRRQYRIPIEKVAKKMRRKRTVGLWWVIALILSVATGYVLITPEVLDNIIELFSPGI